MAQTVSYEAAMANLRSMFSGVDDEVIAMLLQSNNGHLERTVEQLLGITGGAGDVGGGGGGGGAPASNLSVPSGNSRRRSSNSERERQPPGQHTLDMHSAQPSRSAGADTQRDSHSVSLCG